MTGPEKGELSEPELKLLASYLSHTHEPHTDTVAQILTTQKFGSEEPFGAGLADVLYYISDSISTIDRQIFRFNDMRKTLQRMATESPKGVDLPEGAKITPEKLHWFTIRSELTTYYSQAGVLIENLTSDLILEEVVADERISNRVKDDVENKSQWEREWLLFVTGVLDSGEKETIRAAYRRRNSLVHDSIAQDEIEDIDVESEINQAWEAVNLPHEKLFGLEMEYRISEKILGNEFR